LLRTIALGGRQCTWQLGHYQLVGQSDLHIIAIDSDREKIEANPALLEVDRQAIRAACEKFRNHPTTALNFLEGTRFTPEKYGAQAAPRFRHLLNPKTGGVTQVLAALSDRLDKVVDVTINYPEGVPTFWDFMQGRCSRVTMRIACLQIPVEITDTSDEERHRAAVTDWVETLWQGKDERLDQVRAPEVRD